MATDQVLRLHFSEGEKPAEWTRISWLVRGANLKIE